MWTPDRTLSFTASVVEAMEGCKLIQVSKGLSCYGDWPLQGDKCKSLDGDRVAAVTLLFVQDLFQAYFLSTHWKIQ